ncbi:hypothetical protein [Burkholderia contaminans]|uniref:hypothetical protein n=1 Tax=Burkholderia contaminans TaxID=488447 RepID=UPI00158CC7C1|nr:hypothetical protein [Burkholderia contaminans]
MDELDWPWSTLLSLGLAVCELRKALIYNDVLRAGKTPKAGVAGSIPAGRAKTCLFRHSAVSSPRRFPVCSNIPAGWRLSIAWHPIRLSRLSIRFDVRETHLKTLIESVDRNDK